jgi:hypothetical protein
MTKEPHHERGGDSSEKWRLASEPGDATARTAKGRTRKLTVRPAGSDNRRALLIAALSFVQLPPQASALRALHAWLDMPGSTAGEGASMNRVLRLATILTIAIAAVVLSVVDVSLAGPAGSIHKPDLQTRPPANLTIQIQNGQKLLRFSNTVYNWGAGPLEVRPKQKPRNQTEAYQRLYSHDANGTPYLVSETLIGTFVFHRNHHHWHFEAFALYEILDESGGFIQESRKTTVCIRDNADPETEGDSLEHFGWGNNGRCDKNAIEGLSVGYGDTYPWNIDGQSFNITSLEDGCYRLRSTANPAGNIMESNYENNSAEVSFQLSGTTLTVGSCPSP